VLAIKPRGRHEAQEELGTVGVRACVGHGENAWSVVFVYEILVVKFVSIDGFATSAVLVGKVSTLSHELRNDSVEWAALKSKSFFASAKGTEVFCGLRNVSIELHCNPAGFLVTDVYVEEDLCHKFFKL